MSARPYYALPFPTYESAMEASKDAPPDSIVEEINGAWLLLIPASKPVLVGEDDD